MLCIVTKLYANINMCRYIAVLILFFWGICSLSADVLLPTEESPGEVGNRTYGDWANKLQKEVLKNYSRSIRPRRNKNSTVVVYANTGILHLSVDEHQQTIDVHGTLWGNWQDDYLGWDKDEYIGMDSTDIPLWYIWTPKLQLINQANGVRGSHTLLESWTKARVTTQSKTGGSGVRIFLRTSMTFTCIFDYTDYPYDVQVCPAVIVTKYTQMNEVELKVHSRDVFISLSWEEPSPTALSTKKLHISNWYLNRAQQKIIYKSWFNVTDVPPTTDKERRGTKTALYVWFTIQRHEPYFGVVVLLPAVFTAFITVASFWTRRPHHAIYLLIISMVLQGLFTRDLLLRLPPSIGQVPRIAKFFGWNLSLSFVSLHLLLLFQWLPNVKRPPPAFIVRLTSFLRTQPVADVNCESDSGSADLEDTTEIQRTEESEDKVDGTKKQNGTSYGDWIQLAQMAKVTTASIIACMYLIMIYVWIL